MRTNSVRSPRSCKGGCTNRQKCAMKSRQGARPKSTIGSITHRRLLSSMQENGSCNAIIVGAQGRALVLKRASLFINVRSSLQGELARCPAPAHGRRVARGPLQAVPNPPAEKKPLWSAEDPQKNGDALTAESARCTATHRARKSSSAAASCRRLFKSLFIVEGGLGGVNKTRIRLR